MIICQGRSLLGVILLLDVMQASLAKLTATPQRIHIGGQNPTANLTITCTPDAPGITSLLALEIGKKSLDSTNNPIVQFIAGDTNVVVKDTSLQQRMEQTGTINGASGYLQIVLKEPGCNDSSVYYCDYTYNAGSINTEEYSINITAMTYPLDVAIGVNPSRFQYIPASVIMISCFGEIGNQFDRNMANVWVWDWRYENGPNTMWTSYPNTINITYSTPAPIGNCQYNASSTLYHTVSDKDDGRQFRCYIMSQENGKTVTIHTAIPTTMNTEGK